MNPRAEKAPVSEGVEDTYDVVVVGGGAAGLSGALTLARARRSVLVIDGGEPRNAPASGIHNYLGHDGVAPPRLLEIGRGEVTGYGGRVVRGDVVAAERLDDGTFRVATADGSRVTAKRLLVATGLVDELPPVPGLAERWGQDVLHCPYCHGWEVRDQSVGVLATGPLAVHQALLWSQWTPEVTLFLHTVSDLSEEQWEQLAARGVSVVTGEVIGVKTGDPETGGDRIAGVVLAGGRVVPCRAIVVAPHFAARTDDLAGLGLGTVELEMGGHVVGTHVEADPSGATTVPGVWVAGNVTSMTEQVIGAAAAGARAAGAINADLLAEEVGLAVAARQAPCSARAEREVSERVLGDRRHGI